MRHLARASAFLLAATTVWAQPPRTAAVSPTISALQQAVTNQTANAEPQFWSRVERDGAPLVESIAGDTANVLFTFVWHGDSATKNVALVNTAVASYVPKEALLERIPGTDVWYRSYAGRADSRFTYELSVNDNLIPFDEVTDWGARSATFHRDPFNTRVFESGFGRGQSVAEGARALRDEWIGVRPGVAKGRVEQTSVTSKLLGTTRDVWIYTPANYDSIAQRGGTLSLLLTFDGGEYVKSIPVPTILDNLVAAHRIAPMIAVFVGNAEDQRDVELGGNAQYLEFLATELVPWLRTKYRIADSPAGNIVAGSSLGGLAAAFVAHRHPELFGNVLSQSGAFMFGERGDSTPEGITRAIESAPRRDVAFYVEAGIYEVGRTVNGVDLLTSNRHLRDVLRAKGYRVTYDEFAGGHSDLNWRSGFPRGLIALVGR
jgi:enterochelin esterase-like enzyme